MRVRLDPDVAWRAAEYPLIANQRIEAADDGSVTVAARVSGIVETMSWVLSWGGSAEALSPPELREAMQRELEKAHAKYRGPGVVKAKRRGVMGRQNRSSQVS